MGGWGSLEERALLIPRFWSSLALALLFILSGCSGRDEGAPTSPPVTDPPLTGFGLEKFIQGLDLPVHLASAGDGSNRLFIVEQAGHVKVWKDGALLAQPFLDLTAKASELSSYSEQGLLSIAFHPDYKTNGYVYVDYTNREGDSVIERYSVSGANPDMADPGSAHAILAQDQPQANHNGGLLQFGPDGYLYIAFGDGGNFDDIGAGHAVGGNGQSKETMLGKLLRVDVNVPEGYDIPSDNPSVDEAGSRGEIWAYGLRNPWKFSFDRATGDLYIADVGQGGTGRDAWEEVDFQAADSRGGENYGWNLYEGNHERLPGVPGQDVVFPVAEYTHDPGGHCSVTGGYVYRGAAIPTLQGVYLFGDWCSGYLWGLRNEGGSWRMWELAKPGFPISSFGEDETGEVYVADHQGSVYKFVPK